MKDKIKIGILGGDRRSVHVASLLSREGYEAAFWSASGTYEKHDFPENLVRCVDWRSTLEGARAVVLPLPLTNDAVRLNCGKLDSEIRGYVPRITEIVEAAGRDTVMLAGKIPASVRRFADEHGKRMIDYYECEEFQIKNAVPTAEGAIKIAIDELETTLADSNAAVFGYGRVGRTLARKLTALGCKTTCIARNSRDLAWAECDGCLVKPLSDYMKEVPFFDVIFNSIPHVIFDAETVHKIDKKTVCIDLASGAGGFAEGACEKNGLKVIKALSLPGRYSPLTAGKIIYETVRGIFAAEGLL